MRHLERTQNCSVKWLYEQHERGLYRLNKIETNLQAADVFTNPFTDAKNALIIDPKTFWAKVSSGSDETTPGPETFSKEGIQGSAA
eukprot:3486447-Alexandrium_andersonii.AAC.1